MCSDKPRDRKSLKDRANELIEFLTELMVATDETRMECEGTKNVPPSERVLALAADTRSLVRGISNGSITTGQPRMASNLIAVITELENGGHRALASRFTGLLGCLSDDGLAADNVSLGSGRQRA